MGNAGVNSSSGMIQSNSLLAHVAAILALPFTVVVVVPFLARHTFLPAPLWAGIVGALLFAAGISLFDYTVFLFAKRGKGTLAPWTPTQNLVVSGPYRYCRNPMITGVLAMLLGEALFFHSSALFAWAGVFFLINTAYFLLKEEPDLVKRFGESYIRYRCSVPRWIPRLKAYRDGE